MQVVHELEKLGYTFTIGNNAIKYQFSGEREPDMGRTAILLAELKHNKQAVIEYLQRAGRSTRPDAQNKSYSITRAKSLVAEIEEQALSIGWTAKQLAELHKTLSCFIPCHIGLITLRKISIELLNHDGSIRGAVTHYNHEVDQPWLKRTEKQSEGS